MAVMRVEKNNNYTVMSNYHLRDQRLSLKAKGLLSVMLSLPEEWDFTLAGLACISKEGLAAIRAAILELEETGYVIRARVRNKAGQLTDTEYTIYEFPQGENPGSGSKPDPTNPKAPAGRPSQEPPVCDFPALEKPILENPTLENPTLENRTQLNTDISNTDTKKKDQKNTDESNPDQSSTDPSIPQNVGQGVSATEAFPQHAAARPLPAVPTPAGAVHFVQPETLSVQQRYMTDETGIPGLRRRMSYEAFVRKVKRQIDYRDLMDGYNKDEIENILSIMVEVLSTQCEFFTISGKKYPADLVHQRFSEINSGHIEYVLECLHKCGSDIRNIKQYLIAALFNAPATYSSYYGAAVRRDCAWLQC